MATESTQAPPTSRARRGILPLVLVAWMLTTATAFGWLWSYAATAGPSRPAPELITPADDDHYTLLLFLHPECSCSRATLSELARLTARTQGRLSVRVLFVLPPGADDRWRHTSLYDDASVLPVVSVAVDPGGRLARQYGAATSGHAILYAPDGRLVFAGGITPARGHEGDNRGESTILAAVLDNSPPDVRRTPVFGCALFDDDQDDAAARNGKVSD